MAENVDKIVIVCAYKQTPMEILQNTKKSLETFQNKIAGVIVNKLPAKKNHYYYDYYTN
jgi:Mrp family chromosome partitioning ATPase